MVLPDMPAQRLDYVMRRVFGGSPKALAAAAGVSRTAVNNGRRTAWNCSPAAPVPSKPAMVTADSRVTDKPTAPVQPAKPTAPRFDPKLKIARGGGVGEIPW
jgi:hypothetical protein